MSWLDIGTYIVNQQVNVSLSGLILLIIGFIWIGIWVDMGRLDHFPKTPLVSCFVIWLFTTVIILIPTHDKILEVRIAKIKNEIVTRENVNKSAEHIERVLKKLECKYLECEEEEK